MGKAEKFSPSPTYRKGGSKRPKTILEAVRPADGNATRQHARESDAMRMNETIETERETSETDEKWQNVQQAIIEHDPKRQYACTNDNHAFLSSEDPARFQD